MIRENMGIVVENDEKWWRIRSACQQDLMRPKSATFYIDKVQGVAKEFCAYVEKQLDSNGNYAGDLAVDFHTFAFECTGLFALDYKLGIFLEGEREKARAITINNDMLSEGFVALTMGLPYYKWLPNPRWHKLYKQTEDAIHAMETFCIEKVNEAKERIRKDQQKDISKASVLEKLPLRNGIDSNIPPIMAIDMLFGGIDSSGNSASFLLYNLAKYHNLSLC